METLGPAPLPPQNVAPALSGARAAVLEQLSTGPPGATVNELAERMSLHANTIREHLDALVALGLVGRELRAPTGRGRPAWVYMAIDQAALDVRVRDYAGLASALARHIVRSSPDPRGDAIAAGREWGQDLARERKVRPRSQAAVRREVVTMLEELGFAPVDNRGATIVRLRQCPLLDAAQEYPEVVCSVHLGIVRGAISGLGGSSLRTSLDAFAEPGACVLRMDSPHDGS